MTKKFELVKENRAVMQAHQNCTHDTRPDGFDHVSNHKTLGAAQNAMRALVRSEGVRCQIRDGNGKTVQWWND